MSDGLKRVLVRGVASLFLLACGPVMLSCSGVSAEEPFYIASESERAGTPGTIIRQEPAVGPPDGATAFRILYRSMGLKGEPIAASALVVIPRGASPEGGRPIVCLLYTSPSPRDS